MLMSVSAPVAEPPPVPVADFAALVARHQQGVWRYLRVLGAPPDLADDLLQDTFVVALRRGLVDDGPAAVATFLRATARHLWLKQHRRLAALREVQEGDLVWNEHCAHDDGRGYKDALQACVEALPERSRRLVQGTYGEERGREEMGLELGMTADGVKTALRRLRALLRACIERRLR
jgi:RNA polymerase sigma-70 factor (ECF subfamily)